MKWLITAFEPFDRAQSNSSLIVLNELKQLPWNGQVLFHAPVPVTFAGAWRDVERALSGTSGADGVLALGQAETRTRISLERVALNWIDARIADNSGAAPTQAKITEGPDMLWSRIPWDQLQSDPACERSYSAGTFVCNTLMYHACAWAERERKLAGFVHIPLVEGQDDAQFARQPKMELSRAVDSLRGVVEFLTRL